MIYLQDADLTLYNADALEVLRGLPDESVHMCVTSPPFYGLRDYGTGRWEGGNDPGCDHRRDPEGGDRHGRYLAAYVRPETGKATGGAQKKRTEAGEVFHGVCGKCGASRVDQQIGLEATPEEWCAALVGVFREVRRVLRADGTCWVEVGDSYAGSWGAQSRDVVGAEGSAWQPEGTPGAARPASPGSESISANQIKAHPKGTRTGSIPSGASFKPKDLIGAPWMLAFALRADGWYLRSDVVWSRPNPMPESVTDRPTKSHSYVFLLSRSARYFFDQEAVRERYGDPGREELPWVVVVAGHNDRRPIVALDFLEFVSLARSAGVIFPSMLEELG